MNVITHKRLANYAKLHADTASAIAQFTQVLDHAQWKSIDQVREVYPHADLVKVASGNTVTVFNVGGNKCRVITAIHYNRQTIYILAVLTHGEYSRGKWRDVF